MQIDVQEKTKNRLIFKLQKGSHTICNLLKDELWNDANITAAAYNIDHPLIGVPKFIIETNGKTAPEKALADACDRLKKKNKEFLTAFGKVKA